MNVLTLGLIAMMAATCPVAALDAPELPVCGKTVSGQVDSAGYVPMARTLLTEYASGSEAVLYNFDRLVALMEAEEYFAADPVGARRVLDAVVFAAYGHRNQVRKGDPIPYIVHPLDVACILWDVGSVRDNHILAAAVLHDTVEDTEAEIEDIRVRFGQQVATYVLEVTHPEGLDRAARHRWQIANAPHMSEGGRLVKLGDCLSNLSSPLVPEWDAQTHLSYVERTARILGGIRGTNPDLEVLLDGQLDIRRDQVAALERV